jgi:hypothetical protein
MAPEVKTAKNSKLPKLQENCFEPVGKGGWPSISTWIKCLHNIREKNLQDLILKIDLKKAYDCISWDYLRLVLLQCGFGLPTTNWIMGCITSASFVILINGEPSIFLVVAEGSDRDSHCHPCFLSLSWKA